MRKKLYVKSVNIENKIVGCRFNDDDYVKLHNLAGKYNLSEGQYLKALALSNIYKTKIENFIKRTAMIERQK